MYAYNYKVTNRSREQYLLKDRDDECYKVLENVVRLNIIQTSDWFSFLFCSLLVLAISTDTKDVGVKLE